MCSHPSLILAIFATLLIAHACPGESDVCVHARSAYAEGQFAKAGSLLEACRVSGNQNTGVLLLEAKSYYFVDDLQRAQELAKELLARSPKSADAMYMLGHVSHRQKNARESLEWFTKAAALKKPSAQDLRSVGLDYVLLDDYHDAIHWLERAAAFDSDSAETWYDLGRARMMQGDFASAEKALKRSLQLEPRLVKAENNLGVTYETENRIEDALNAYRLAIAWQSTSSTPSEQPFLNLGTLLVTHQQGKEAIPLLERAVSIVPTNVKAHEQLARALEMSGDLQRAILEMNRAVTLDSTNARLHFELGQMDRRAGRLEEARKELRLSGELYGAHSTSPDY